jgi:hypothetical protein
MRPFVCVRGTGRHSLVQLQGKARRSLRLVHVSLAEVLALFCVFATSAASNAQSCPVNTPHIQGVWRTLPYLMPINRSMQLSCTQEKCCCCRIGERCLKQLKRVGRLQKRCLGPV